MNQAMHVTGSFIAGAALGLLYFRWLWRTVIRLPNQPNPHLAALNSYVMRMVFVICGFYLIMDNHWERLVFALGGFMVMRELLIKRFGKGANLPLT